MINGYDGLMGIQGKIGVWGADREILQVDQGVWGTQRDKGGKRGIDRELGVSRRIQIAGM